MLFFNVVLAIAVTLITIWMNKSNNDASVNYLVFIISCICGYVIILSIVKAFLKPKEKKNQDKDLVLRQDVRLWMDRLYFALFDNLDGLDDVRVIMGIKNIDRRSYRS